MPWKVFSRVVKNHFYNESAEIWGRDSEGKGDGKRKSNKMALRSRNVPCKSMRQDIDINNAFFKKKCSVVQFSLRKLHFPSQQQFSQVGEWGWGVLCVASSVMVAVP